ncbi:MAG: hypothetical protein HN811_06140 [Phycisphaerae bacterium]|nr:hypothetical protein [Phycisphaerae bacterium]
MPMQKRRVGAVGTLLLGGQLALIHGQTGRTHPPTSVAVELRKTEQLSASAAGGPDVAAVIVVLSTHRGRSLPPTRPAALPSDTSDASCQNDPDHAVSVSTRTVP